MKEQDYIDATDIRSLGIVIDAMRHICPENSKVIDEKVYTEILATISKWQSRLFESVRIEDE